VRARISSGSVESVDDKESRFEAGPVREHVYQIVFQRELVAQLSQTRSCQVSCRQQNDVATLASQKSYQVMDRAGLASTCFADDK
jgi:hypothetical protein